MEPLRTLLTQRRLPELMRLENGEEVCSVPQWEQRREEILKLLSEEEYGVSPAPVKATWTLEEEKESFAGKGLERRFTVSFPTPKGTFSFPMYLAVPKKGKPVPCVLLMNFRPQVPDLYYPVEEILDHGFASACIFYQDITSDDGDMENGLAGCFSLSQRGETGMGKIGCWAYGMSRGVDVLLEQPEIAGDGIITAGHSRLGKTSLWCAAQDQRVAGCIANNAGCSGDAITRQKEGERVEDITRVFPFWFAQRYQRYRGGEERMPFDQHFLLGAIAPRPLAVGGAELDQWADPRSQLLSCMAAAPAWKVYGREALAEPYEMPRPGMTLRNGWVGYHLRKGTHFFSREDWAEYLRFFSRHFLK